ncbi:NAD(P)H dehydrogenase (quinone) [Sphingomonas palmae]|uniref:NAD(P)H dehydrogenase (Quinone) n=1 Tax=Sphingomonas palmae TaxID=1855283 RepID=A0A1H7T7V3_9SPHN|nr:hypothetical protein [Sphingomonas palmae]SEL80356.1 NAD(P)H dehydrogenase (quinone) [Sphingomonas palmae]
MPNLLDAAQPSGGALAHQDVQLVIIHDATGGPAEKLAQAVADGVESAGAQALIRSAAPSLTRSSPEAVPPDALWNWPSVTLGDLERGDGVVIVTTTSFGRISSSMAGVLDEAIDNLVSGELSGLVGSAIVCPGDHPGGEVGTYLSVIGNLMQLGMVVAGKPKATGADDMADKHDMGATPSPGHDLEEAYRQGAAVAKIAVKLAR